MIICMQEPSALKRGGRKLTSSLDFWPEPAASLSPQATSFLWTEARRELESMTDADLDRFLIQEEKRMAERSLAEFLRQAWIELEPTTPLAWEMYLEPLCLHLEALARGQILNLAITIPPGCTKSITCNVIFPAWVWGPYGWPECRFLTGANESDLAIRDTTNCRRLIDSDWYQARWGDKFKLTSDQNVKSFYVNSRLGHRIVTTVGSKVTGKKGDILILDDPNDAQKVHSEAERLSVHRWWDQAFYNRVNDFKTGRRLIIGQRTHPEDLIGHVLDAGGFERLHLPEEYDPEDPGQTSIGWRDPRTQAGEWLRPSRFGAAQAAEARKRLGEHGYQTQHNQRASTPSGDFFKREWFKLVEVGPAEGKRVRYWDKAASQNKGDFSAGVLMNMVPGGLWVVEDVVRGQWSSRQRNEVMEQTAYLDHQRFGDNVAIWMEQEPGSSGKESAEISVRELAGFDVHAETVSGQGDKQVRARPFAAQAEGGNVRIVKGPWNRDYIDEHCGFPFGRNDDQVDGSSGAFNKLILNQKKELMFW